jgi:deoxyribodipyrimidine photo-lyase
MPKRSRSGSSRASSTSSSSSSSASSSDGEVELIPPVPTPAGDRISAFVFQRSLRLDDNRGLLKALEQSQKVFPIFCVDPRQCSLANNRFGSPFSIGFMLQSLQDLQKQLQAAGSDLLLTLGQPHEVLPPLLSSLKVSHLYVNEDYTPFAIERAEALAKAWKALDPSKNQFVQCEDYLLHRPGTVSTGMNTAYKVFTPFYEAIRSIPVAKPVAASPTLLARLAKGSSMALMIKTLSEKAWKQIQDNSKKPHIPGGRTAALVRLKDIPKTQVNYPKMRDVLTFDTSTLSPYLKFGCISCREAWQALGQIPNKESAADIRRQLIWREFYYHLYICYPEDLEWENAPKYTESTVAASAHPLVKACFNQLNETGWLHNRGRMILANYILKQKGDYWKQGDLLYAKRLVDYDPFINIGNWKWIEKQPIFRQLKPEAQMKWDHSVDGKEKGVYTRRWTRPGK